MTQLVRPQSPATAFVLLRWVPPPSEGESWAPPAPSRLQRTLTTGQPRPTRRCVDSHGKDMIPKLGISRSHPAPAQWPETLAATGRSTTRPTCVTRTARHMATSHRTPSDINLGLAQHISSPLHRDSARASLDVFSWLPREIPSSPRPPLTSPSLSQGIRRLVAGLG